MGVVYLDGYGVSGGGGGGGSQIIVVANYSALPPANTVAGKFYLASASQGTKWLPFSLGGTYYNSGLYYSNGTTWEYQETPNQATQSQVNMGTDNTMFVTPLTFTNAEKIVNSFQKNVDDSDDITEGVIQGFVPLPEPFDVNYYLSGLRTWALLPVVTGDDGETNFPSGVTLGTAISYTITANTNNLVVPDIETAIVLRLTSTGNFSLTGLVPFNNAKAWMLFIVNVGVKNIIFPDNSASSAAQNRWLLGANKTIQPNEGIICFYDPISNRWRGGGINI
jgi:hypothetical protein